MPNAEIVVDDSAHNREGPLGVSVRQPVIAGARTFVAAVGIPRGDYNGADRLRAAGVVSLLQTTTRGGKRASTYHAFLEGEAEARANLTILAGVQVTRIVIEHAEAGAIARGIEYRDAGGQGGAVFAAKEVILSAGAVGSPHLLLLSGIGPEGRTRGRGREVPRGRAACRQAPQRSLPGRAELSGQRAGVSMLEMGISMGPDALRAPAGSLPAVPADDAGLPPELAALKAEAERRLGQWFTTGEGLVASSLYDAAAWYSTGLSDPHTNDAQLSIFVCGYNDDIWRRCLKVDTTRYFTDAAQSLAPDAETVLLLANPVQPRSEGELVLTSADANVHPAIHLNYFSDPHDMKVTLSILRKGLEVARS